MKKLLFLMVMLVSFSVVLTVNAATGLSAFYNSGTGKIVIQGELQGAEKAAVTMIMVDKGIAPEVITSNDIKYVDQTTIANDKYSFIFAVDVLEKDISEYSIFINQNGSNVSSSIIGATRFGELFRVKVSGLTEKQQQATAVAKIESIFSGATGTYDMTMLLAYYSEDGKLLGVRKSDFNTVNITADITEVTLLGEIPDETAEIKAFVFENLISLMPCSLSRTRIVDQAIVCWGDSLTNGGGGGGVNYPAILHSLSGKTVYNMGIGGETATTIATRQGGLRMVLTSGVTIPADMTATEIVIKGSNQIDTKPLVGQGVSGVNPCYIQGVQGTLSYNSTSKKYFFTRSTEGQETAVEAGTEIVTDAMLNRRKDIAIIFIGQNGGYAGDINNLISIQLNMVDYLDYQDKEYVIVGLTTGTAEERAAMETAMAEKWGDRYINMRQSLCNAELLEAAGITLTSTDLADIAIGKVPSCILSDTIHFNSKGYTIIGEKIYEKMIELGILQ